MDITTRHVTCGLVPSNDTQSERLRWNVALFGFLPVFFRFVINSLQDDSDSDYHSALCRSSPHNAKPF